jgi:hypothetical protein
MTNSDDKQTGLTQKTGWQIGVRRTFPISFHQENIPGAGEREERRDLKIIVLDELEKVMIKD